MDKRDMLTKAINPAVYLTIDIHILIGHNALKNVNLSKCPDYEDYSQKLSPLHFLLF